MHDRLVSRRIDALNQCFLVFVVLVDRECLRTTEQNCTCTSSELIGLGN